MLLRITIKVFALSDETAAALTNIKNERQFARAQISTHIGGLDAAIHHLSENETPDLLIVEVNETQETLFNKLEALADVFEPDSRLLLIGQENDIKLYRHLIELGVSDYICGEIDSETIQSSINQLFSDPSAIELGRVIACLGARGGAGSSTVAANLSYMLGQKYSEEVILIDLDMCFGTLALSFNLQQRQSIADALAQPNRLDDVLMERFMLKYNEFLSVVPAPVLLGGEFDVQIDAFETLLDLVRRMAAFVVIDLPHQWNPWVNEILLDANEVVVTAYPDLANLRDAKNIFDRLQEQRGIGSPTRLVFNKIGLAKVSELGAKDFRDPLGVSPILSVPFEAGLFGTALNNGQCVSEVNQRSKSAKRFSELASIVGGRDEISKNKSKFLPMNFFKSET
ncbi:MAG: hypothetical protein CFH10_02146 [Alphaproteobacteria bacterium MarineAlpha4_Bin2]|nr:MAG: hypothetical protein CFH10_02146 [Alphaproteobacteria bacterium MarineAlpha4_Bin2]